MSAEDFYSELPSFTDFSTIGVLDDYKPVPDDWFVLAADIVRSGDAVAAGRYKEVNMIGAAVIAAVLNRLDRDRVPFVFGGDGAMLVVPQSDVEAGREALAGVVELARQVTELELRAAAIPVARLRELGSDIRLRKYRLSPGNHLAMIIGDGLGVADRILKDPEASREFAVTIPDAVTPPLDGLSCRWEPLASKQGHIVSLIIKPDGDKTLPKVMQDLSAQMGFNPLADEKRTCMADEDHLRYSFFPKGLALEVHLTSAGHIIKGHAKALVQSALFVVGRLTGWRIGPFDPARYMKELSLNTDHRKVGDSLQLVLDLTSDELKAVQRFLESSYEAGELIYGLHVSSEALMTCFVQDIGNSHHIHFVDGANGGFSVAAAEFKQRQSAVLGHA